MDSAALKSVSDRPTRVRTAPRRIKAVLFDVDGVLADTAGLHSNAWRRIALENKLPFDDDRAQHLRGLSREDSLRHILDGRQLPADIFAALMDRKNEYYVESLQSLGPGDVLPGAAELIADLKLRGLQIAAVSASRNAPAVLRQLEIADSFNVILHGAEVSGGNRYLRAAQKLRVPPEHCVVIEDSIAGVDLACEAGIACVAVGPMGERTQATVVLKTLCGTDLIRLQRLLDSHSPP